MISFIYFKEVISFYTNTISMYSRIKFYRFAASASSIKGLFPALSHQSVKIFKLRHVKSDGERLKVEHMSLIKTSKNTLLK